MDPAGWQNGRLHEGLGHMRGARNSPHRARGLWAGSAPSELSVSEPWPAAVDPAWHRVQRRILDHFAFAMNYSLRMAGQRPPERARLRLAHPDDEATIEQLRAIHNGEMAKEYDLEAGLAYPQPRVWRHKVGCLSLRQKARATVFIGGIFQVKGGFWLE